MVEYIYLYTYTMEFYSEMQKKARYTELPGRRTDIVLTEKEIPI
jgi:hypothetical protein